LKGVGEGLGFLVHMIVQGQNPKVYEFMRARLEWDAQTKDIQKMARFIT
jgi:hypothetical protein